jgi:Thaumatin family
MRITVGLASLCAVVMTAACGSSPKEQSSSGTGATGNSSSGTSVPMSGANTTSGATSVQSGTTSGSPSSGSPSSGATVESGTSSGTASSGTASTTASGSTESGTTTVSGTPGVEPPNAGMTNASDVTAARIVAGPSIDCPDGCNTDASYPAMMAVGTPMPIGDQTLPRKLYIENQCTYKTWTFAQPAGTLPGGVPLELDPGQAVVLGWSNGFSGRIWPRTQCTGTGGDLKCEQGNGPDTLAEFTLTAGMASDWYDISLVDGFSLPVGIIQLDAPWGLDPSYVSGGPLPADVQQCGSPVCAVDLNPGCPASQQMKDGSGNIWGCKNGQSANGGHGATPVTTYLKAGCPTSYTYAFDDPQSLFLCKSAAQNGGVGAKDYKVIYCPTQGPTAGFP